ncbi:MAG: FAD-dependent oxidoreductase [SAR324 cluster bacterium]|nr:FAD-dependent oxidoreductase [SAR324 cluster bacterium]
MSPNQELLRPLVIRGHRLANRIVFGAHLTNFGGGNLFGSRHLAYYGERAAGGAGMIVTEALTVHPLDYPYEHVPFGHQEQIVPSLQRLGTALRDSNPHIVLLCQLSHTGGQTSGRLLRQSPWAPSAVPDVASKKMARAMEPWEIDQVVQGFAETAGRVARGGLDGVELNAGQTSLLRQFLSPLTNFRTDDYGGGLDNRMRLLRRVIHAVRGAMGEDRLLGVKLCGDELAPWGGLTPDDAAAIAKALVEEREIDYLSIQIGGPYTPHITDAGMPMPQAHAAHLADGVKAAIGAAVPVFAEGRIESVDAAARVLAQGQADAVVMTRALISDPDLPAKLRAAGRDGNPEPIRPHVGMNRYFVVKGDWNRPLGDLANPRAGREERLPLAARSAEPPPRPVLVIGGGPAGMEAALVLARQGRSVHLMEARSELGGTARLLAQNIDTRLEFAPLVAYYREMLHRLGVTVETNRTVTAYEPAMDQFDAIWLATGGRAPPIPWEFPEGMDCVTARQLLEHPPQSVSAENSQAVAVVIDQEYGYRMAGAVEQLLVAGYRTHVVTDDFFVGRGLVESGEFLWFNRVAEQGAIFHPRRRVESLRPCEVVCVDIYSGESVSLSAVRIVVHAAPEVPADQLLEILSQHHPHVAAIGDTRAPRLMGEAILHAHQSVLVPVAT